MTVWISPNEGKYLALKRQLWHLKQELFHVLLPLLHHVMHLNERNCHLTMPMVEGCGVGDRLPEIKYGKCKYTTTKHVYNESENLIESCAVHLDLSGPLNITEMVPVIGKEGMVSHVQLHHTWDYLMPGLCCLIKPASLEKTQMSFPAQIHTVML